MSRIRFNSKNLLFSAVAVVSSLIVFEFALQVISLVSLRVGILLSRTPEVLIALHDDVLGTRPNPTYPGHDKKGFRNRFVPNQVTIVALGDSQTYGAGVKRNQAWPQQVEALGGIKTYNMAWGGYSPPHSLLLWKEAFGLKPKLVIEAFYAGNDLFEAYRLVYCRNQLAHLKATQKNILSAIADAQKEGQLVHKITGLFQMGRNPDASIHGTFREFLAKHSKLYGMLRQVRYRLIPLFHESLNQEGFRKIQWESIRQDALKKGQSCQVVDNGGIKTVLTPNHRLCALNLDDPRIIEGHRISLEAIRLMGEQARKTNIEFFVLFIPTKELVFKNVVYEGSADVPSVYKTLIRNEELFWRKTKEFLEKEGIYFVDALSSLRRCVGNFNHPYQLSSDGHPSAIGHRAIADLVLSEIEKHYPSKNT